MRDGHWYHDETCNFETAINWCKVRGYIARVSKPAVKYWKNHLTTLEARVPAEDQEATDWDFHDPHDEGPAYLSMG